MHCSRRVRMNRSATPLHSGSPSYDGEIRPPSHLTSLIHAIRDVLRPPVAADLQPARDVLGEPAEGVAHALPNRLEGRPAIADLRGVPARHLIDAVIDGAKERAPPVCCGVE